MKNFCRSSIVFLLALSGCSFDYGVSSNEGRGRPDIEMDKVEYTRVRNGDPLVRFQADKAERWEERRTMELENFSFEQYENHGEANARGGAGTALVELDSGNIDLENGVSIEVDSEDLTIETGRLRWQDKERILSGPEAGTVVIRRSDGTFFTGRGFTANARSRAWEFTGEVSGTYIHEDEEEDEAETEAGDAKPRTGQQPLDDSEAAP
ncbi:MAG: LPS export ABC transporter periplasmic protein LptC [Treponema sp.]|jgi:LPS export ABC transporter protein LptC|nr:LPS export ABC transporter periplasmic protein LptC [Treponema sp.]